jgi:hypothetical protein
MTQNLLYFSKFKLLSILRQRHFGQPIAWLQIPAIQGNRPIGQSEYKA